MAEQVIVCILLLVSAVTVVAADEVPGQLICPQDQDSTDSPYRFTLAVPSDCKNSPILCNYYLAVRRNPVDGFYADFKLIATTQGYVAVGFSKDRLMGEDDVIGCKRDPETGMISVVSAWNPTPRHAPNERDPSQSGVCPYDSSYDDGQLSCRFSRYIAAVNHSYDYDLNNSYILFLARSDDGSSPHFLKHDEAPLVSYFPINVLHDNITTAGYISRSSLVKTHGVILLLVMIFYYGAKIVLPFTQRQSIHHSRKTGLFKIFVVLCILTVVIMAIGILFAIIANLNNNPPRLISSTCPIVVIHTVFGYIMPLTVVAHLILFRCFSSPKRTLILYIYCPAAIVGFLGMTSSTGLFVFQSGCAFDVSFSDNFPRALIYAVGFSFAFVSICIVAYRRIYGCCLNEQKELSSPCIRYIFLFWQCSKLVS